MLGLRGTLYEILGGVQGLRAIAGLLRYIGATESSAIPDSRMKGL